LVVEIVSEVVSVLSFRNMPCGTTSRTVGGVIDRGRMIVEPGFGQPFHLQGVLGHDHRDETCEERPEMPRRYVLTGAPGAGKTALAMTLRERGYLVMAEAATDLIADEQARGVDESWRTVDFLDKIARLQRQRQLSQIADPIPGPDL
jgi:hypothetical protein